MSMYIGYLHYYVKFNQIPGMQLSFFFKEFTMKFTCTCYYHIYGLKFQWMFFHFYVVIIDFKFCLILFCWFGLVSSHSFRFFCFVWFRFDCFRGFFLVSILFSTWHEPLNPGWVNNTSRHYLVNMISSQYSI